MDIRGKGFAPLEELAVAERAFAKADCNTKRLDGHSETMQGFRPLKEEQADNQGLGGGDGLGIRNVHARPYTNVFPTKWE